MTREELVVGIKNYWEDMESASEAKENEANLRVVQLAPHADMIQLLYYSDREYSIEEIADEALYREELWKQAGRSAVRARIRRLMEKALADESLEVCYHYAARDILKALDREESRERSKK